MTKTITIVSIAKVAHEANRAYCESIGDDSQHSWGFSEEWQRESAIKGVKFAIDNPQALASAQHEAWLNDKISEGWKYGEVKSTGKKEHPCCVPYDELPIEQQTKDSIFLGIVRAMEVLL